MKEKLEIVSTTVHKKKKIKKFFKTMKKEVAEDAELELLDHMEDFISALTRFL